MPYSAVGKLLRSTRTAHNLSNTRLVIHASDPQGIALPWELMRDADAGETVTVRPWRTPLCVASPT